MCVCVCVSTRAWVIQKLQASLRKMNETEQFCCGNTLLLRNWGSSGDAMVNMLDEQTYKNKFEFPWMPLSNGLVQYQSKKKKNIA